MIAVAMLVATACSGGAESSPGSTTAFITTTSITPTTVTTSSVTTTVTTSSTTTSVTTSSTVAIDACAEKTAFDVADRVVRLARLSPEGEWDIATESNPFFGRTNSAEEFAARLSLDCAVEAAQVGSAGNERLLLAAWTGPRMAFVVQAEDQPATPFRNDAMVTVITEEPRGEFLLDDRTIWGATLEHGETIVIGHVDYSLGATAKAWQSAVPSPPNGEPTLEAESVAIQYLEAAGARNVGIAQFAEFGSVEGLVMFVTPSGQIGIVDVAPRGAIEPMTSRYLTGPTRVVGIGDLDVRITEPGVDDIYAIAGEIGWWCNDFGWIMEPPLNGTIEEMIDMVSSLVVENDCVGA